ncbi:DNA polymerase, partial [Klebsiella pneumoniae]
DQWLRDSGAPARMILQVHDELVFETESSFVEDLRLQVVERMSQAAKLRVPLVVDTGIGNNWDEAH